MVQIPRYSLIMALELSKIVQNEGFRSLVKRGVIRSLSNWVNTLMGIVSRPSSLTCQWGFPLSYLMSFHPVFIKLGEYFGGHNISTKF